jgi:DNA transformation protein and related proteins
MPNKREYLDFVIEWLSPLGTITARSMFGGHSLYCHDLVFALVADNVLHLKVDDATRPRFETLGLKPFQPFPDNPGTMQYYPPPPEFFEDSEAMKDWGRAAIEAAHRARAKKPARKKKAGAK